MARQAQIPGDGYINETGTRQTQIPGGGYVNESAVTAALTGTVTASITEADIVAGNKTIILTLAGDTWIPS